MIELRLGLVNNVEKKFIPTKKEFLEKYLNSLRKITIKQTLFNGGGSLFVLLISGISLFSTIKLM